MPHDLTPEQRERFSRILAEHEPNNRAIHYGSAKRLTAALAAEAAQMLADERERIAREIEATAAEHEAEDKAEGCNSRYCAGWLLGQTHAARIARGQA